MLCVLSERPRWKQTRILDVSDVAVGEGPAAASDVLLYPVFEAFGRRKEIAEEVALKSEMGEEADDLRAGEVVHWSRTVLCTTNR